MLIKNARKTEDNSWEFSLFTTEDEVSFLINYSVLSLIKKGILQIESGVEEQEVSLNYGSLQ